MTAQRSRKEELEYRNYKNTVLKNRSDCVFCQIDKFDSQFIKGTKHFKVVNNTFPYSIWDGELVADHLMIVPKVHTDKLGNLTKNSAIEFVKLIEEFEDKGFNLYARAPSSSIKSVVHQHTHMIKPLGRRRKFLIFSRKPYIRISF